MNKNNSKYRKTALLMNQALLLLLEKKDFDFITIKEVCNKAGVNRSTFYLHYENLYELLEETIKELGKKFISKFSNVAIVKGDVYEENAFLISPEYLMPYLEFVKEHKRVLKVIHRIPNLFNAEKVYKDMYYNIFLPALKKFNVVEEKQPYVLEYFTGGVVSIVKKWIELDCENDIQFIMQLIIECVGYKQK